MANPKKRVAKNVEGPFFVDSTCIDCDACRKLAPDNFSGDGDTAFVSKDPSNPEELFRSQLALLSCPVGAIGDLKKRSLIKARESLPLPLTSEVFLNGFNSPDSYGADSYFIKSAQGNWMVDCPRFSKTLVKRFEEMGGVDFIFLTHRDDVADHEKYAAHFKARRIIHKDEGIKGVEDCLEGPGPWEFGEAKILFAPGHTKGHCLLLWKEKYLFTGDHFSWSDRLGRFQVFKYHCWYDYRTLIESAQELVELENVEWVLPGHGRRKQVSQGSFPDHVRQFLKTV